MNMPLVKHGTNGHETAPKRRDLWQRFADDRLRWPFLFWPELGEVVRLEEFHENDTLVIRAELPGIDPDKDVEISVTDHVLRIEAERHEEEKTEGRRYTRREFRYGSFVSEVPLPAGATEEDVKATYNDGILEIRVPVPQVKAATKIAVTKS